MTKQILKLALIFLLVGLPIQAATAEIDRNSNLETIGNISLQADTYGEKPVILSLNLSENQEQIHVNIQSEPNATIEIQSNEVLIQTLQTDDTAQTQTTLKLEQGFNTFMLTTIDYWGNVSESTELTAERNSDLIVFAHHSSQITFTEGQEETSYSIINLNKDSISHIADTELTLSDSDFQKDTDNDSRTDAIEIVKGEDPNLETPLFNGEIDVIDLNGITFTNSNFFLYGKAPVNQNIKIFLRNDAGARYLAWSGQADPSGTFTVHTPFPQEGTFTIIVQVFDEFDVSEHEKEYGQVTYNRSQEEVPLTINAHYKVNSPTITTSIFSIEEIGRLGSTTLFGPNIDLNFEGETNPLSDIFILWKGKSEWFLETMSHPESGIFSIQAPESVPNGDYTAYIYSHDLTTNIISDVVRANFNVTSTANSPQIFPINNALYLLATLAYLFAIGWVTLSIKKHYHKPSCNDHQ